MDLKNAITIYNNKENLVDDYFISIHKVSDNLGSSWKKSNTIKQNQPILKVGDDYELLVEAMIQKTEKLNIKLLIFLEN